MFDKKSFSALIKSTPFSMKLDAMYTDHPEFDSLMIVAISSQSFNGVVTGVSAQIDKLIAHIPGFVSILEIPVSKALDIFSMEDITEREVGRD